MTKQFWGLWKAWVSSRSIDARDNIGYRASSTFYPYRSGSLVANKGQLLTGALANPIDTVAFTLVLTSTKINGTVADDYMLGTCYNWTMNDNSFQVEFGTSFAADNSWTIFSGENCSIHEPVYCFQTP